MTNNPGLCEAKSLRRGPCRRTVYEKAITITDAEMKPPSTARRSIRNGIAPTRVLAISSVLSAEPMGCAVETSCNAGSTFSPFARIPARHGRARTTGRGPRKSLRFSGWASQRAWLATLNSNTGDSGDAGQDGITYDSTCGAPHGPSRPLRRRHIRKSDDPSALDSRMSRRLPSASPIMPTAPASTNSTH